MSSVNIQEKKENTDSASFEEMFNKKSEEAPIAGDIVSGIVIEISNNQVKININGYFIGVVRGPELYFEAPEYGELKVGDAVESTVIDEENENGEIELSFKMAGQEKAITDLEDAYQDKTIIRVKVTGANKGGLTANYRQIPGFLPVSQLAPEHYPRVSGGDKNKIFEKLKTFIGKDLQVKVSALNFDEDKIIFSEKDAWTEQQKDVISKYKVGSVIEGKITAIADFGIFVNFGQNLEGLIHISELAWQRIDDPADLFKIGDSIKAEIISMDGAKIFLSAKKLQTDPWVTIEGKYKVGQVIEGKIIKINPFGLFIELDESIHGLAHISQLGLAPGERIEATFKPNEKKEFTITSIQPKEHRLGLTLKKIKKASGDEEIKLKANEDEKDKE
ncbi:30S ribosomal protein S1 [Patescibacteria group bacterium]|nr:30S ribosomal protein S1 [Patescibacteria group bacterium]